MHSFIISILAASGLALAAPVAATPEQIEIRIDFGDLDLTKPRDVDKLERRIERAVKKACTIESSILPGGKSIDTDCLASTTTAALAEVDRRRDQRLALASK